MWLIDFVQVLAKNVVEMDAEMSKCASKAYNDTLSPRHPWLIRKGVHAALGQQCHAIRPISPRIQLSRYRP